MRLTLIHNPAAGTDSPAADELVAFLKEGGHTVTYVSTQVGTPAVGRNSELLVAAGGDGTLKKVFAMASHRRVPPILMLPLGTANNIARSLGGFAPWQEILAGLGRLERFDFPYHRMNCGGVEEPLFESGGLGLFATFLWMTEHRADRIDAMAAGAQGAPRDFGSLAELAGRMTALPLEIGHAGTPPSSDRYLMVELMNIPMIGPGMVVGSERSLERENSQLVLVPESHRNALVDYFEARAQGREATFPGIRYDTADGITITGDTGDVFHANDDGIPWPRSGQRRVTFTRDPLALPMVRVRQAAA